MSLEGRVVLFLSLMPPVLQPLAHFSVSSGKPPSLHHQWDFRVLPVPSRRRCQALSDESSHFSVMLLLQIVGSLSSLRRDNSPLLAEELKCKSEGKANWQLPSITSMSSWDRLRENTQNRTGLLNLITWITLSVAEWLFNAFLELNFGASLKLRHVKVIGVKMTALSCHGNCAVSCMLPLCSERSWHLCSGESKYKLLSIYYRNLKLLSNIRLHKVVSLQVYLHLFCSQKHEEVHCGREPKQLSEQLIWIEVPRQ